MEMKLRSPILSGSAAKHPSPQSPIAARKRKRFAIRTSPPAGARESKQESEWAACLDQATATGKRTYQRTYEASIRAAAKHSPHFGSGYFSGLWHFCDLPHTVKKWRGCHCTLLERGGRERESNPPR